MNKIYISSIAVLILFFGIENLIACVGEPCPDLNREAGSPCATLGCLRGIQEQDGPFLPIRKDIRNEVIMTVSSSAFKDGDSIPEKYSCDGVSYSPPLAWSQIEGAQSYAVIIEDPDAPQGTFVHWLVINIPRTTTSISENALTVNFGGTALLNSAGEEKYYPLCPPSGIHHYVFRVYALDVQLKLLKGVTKREFDQAIQDHVLGVGELTGTYTKKHP